jgi:hypothetical protein
MVRVAEQSALTALPLSKSNRPDQSTLLVLLVSGMTFFVLLGLPGLILFVYGRLGFFATKDRISVSYTPLRNSICNPSIET